MFSHSSCKQHSMPPQNRFKKLSPPGTLVSAFNPSKKSYYGNTRVLWISILPPTSNRPGVFMFGNNQHNNGFNQSPRFNDSQREILYYYGYDADKLEQEAQAYAERHNRIQAEQDYAHARMMEAYRGDEKWERVVENLSHDLNRDINGELNSIEELILKGERSADKRSFLDSNSADIEKRLNALRGHIRRRKGTPLERRFYELLRRYGALKR